LKKLFIATASLAVMGALITPKFIATQVNHQTSNLVNTINEWPYYQAQLVEYSPGWFGHSGTLRLTVDLAGMFADGQPADVDSAIIDVQFKTQHGPITTSGLGLFNVALSVPAQGLRQHINWPTDNPFYQFDGKLDFEGGLTFADNITAFSYESVENKKIDVGQYSGQAVTKNGILSYRGEIEKVTIDIQDVNAEIQSITINTELPEKLTAYFNQELLHNYSSKINIGHIKLESPNEQPLALIDLGVDMVSAVAPDTRLGQLDLVYRLKQYDYDGHQGKDIELATQIKNLDEAAFIGLSQLLNDETAASNPELYIENFNLGLKTHLLGLMTSQPEINVTSLRGFFTEGDINAHLNTKLVDVVNLPEDLEDKTFWLEHIKADSELRASKSLTRVITQFLLKNELRKNPNFAEKSNDELSEMAAQQVDGLLSLLESQGTLIGEGQYYRLQFEMHKGEAKLNGQPMPLAI